MEEDLPTFTPREVQVAELLAAGKQAPVIALMLGISHETVRGYCKRLRAKTHHRTMTGAIAAMFRDGWLD